MNDGRITVGAFATALSCPAASRTPPAIKGTTEAAIPAKARKRIAGTAGTVIGVTGTGVRGIGVTVTGVTVTADDRGQRP